MDQKKDGERWSELDGMRGIAACIVVIYHFYFMLQATAPGWIQWALAWSPLYLFVSGLESMLLFFLISGIVLSLPYLRRPNRLDYPGFLIRRISRIYFPYLAALFVAITGNAFFHGLKINDWFNQTWAEGVNLGTVIQHVLFIGNYNYSAFNGAFWTLVFEMRISLVFPLLCFLVIRLGWVQSLILALGSIFLAKGLGMVGISLQTAYTLRVAAIFITGIQLAKYLFNNRESLAKIRPIVRHGVLLVSLALYIFAHLVHSIVEEWIVVIGGCGIVFSAFAEPAFARILRLPALQFLGRMSYGIFLLHIPILYLLVYLFYPRVPIGWLFLPFVACVLGASVVFYHLVINPSVQFGRRVAKAVGSRAKALEQPAVEPNPSEYTPQVKAVD